MTVHIPHNMVIVEGMTLALAGIAVGVTVAAAGARLLEAVTFGVSATDPVILGGVAGTLALVALTATIVPAWVRGSVGPWVRGSVGPWVRWVPGDASRIRVSGLQAERQAGGPEQ